MIAPSLIPKRPGERVKTNRRDALTLARLHRAGELTAIWVPDPGHEAVRELVRAREAAMEDLRAKRQHLQSFLLRHGRVFPGRQPWTRAHARWLSELIFEHPAQYLVLREYRQAIEDAEARLERLTQQVAEVVSTWSMAPVVEAYQALRGVALLTAVTFVAEIGDVRRFESPRQLMAYLGLVPSESSTGERVRRGSITKAGNPRARRVLIEGAWTYRFPARMSRLLQERQEGLPAAVRAIAWKAQVRLCARYRRLMAAGKRQTVVTTAIAREMAAFLWAIGREVEPALGRIKPNADTVIAEGPISLTDICCCAAPEAGPRWGTLGSIVWPMSLRRRPLADRGSPGRTHGNAVTNPRIRVCSTVVLTALPPALRNRSIVECPDRCRERIVAFKAIDNEHQS